MELLQTTEVLGQQIRVYGTVNEPLFLAKDVANWLELSNVSDMVSRVDENEVTKLNLGSQQGEVWMLTEDGIYEVLMQSRKPIAREFKKEVKKILKDIRKNGMYATDELLDNPDLFIATITKLKEERELRQKLELENKELQEEIEENQPKVDFFDIAMDSEELTTIQELAKILGTGQNKLFKYLKVHKILLSDNLPYQDYIDNKCCEVKLKSFVDPNGKSHNYKRTFFTPKGVKYMEAFIQKNPL